MVHYKINSKKAIQTYYCTNNFNKTEIELYEILITYIQAYFLLTRYFEYI